MGGVSTKGTKSINKRSNSLVTTISNTLKTSGQEMVTKSTTHLKLLHWLIELGNEWSLLAARTSAEIRELDNKYMLLNKLMRSDLPLTKTEVAIALGKIQHPTSVCILQKFDLSEEDENTIYHVLSSLLKIRKFGALEIFNQYYDNANYLIRMGVAKVLAQQDAAFAIPLLVAYLSDINMEVVLTAQTVLSELNQNLVIPALFDALKTDAEPNVKQQIIDTLGKSNTPKIAQELITILESEDHRDIRNACLAALGSIRYTRAVDVLGKYVNDSDEITRRIAIVAIGKMGTERAAGWLIGCLKHPDPAVRRLSMEYLIEDVYEKYVPIEENLLNIDDPDIQCMVAKRYSINGNQQAIEILRNLIHHTNHEIRGEAILALASLKNPEHHQDLAALLEDHDVKVRCLTALALGIHGDERSIPLLHRKIFEEQEEVLLYYIRGVEYYQDRQSIPVLIKLYEIYPYYKEEIKNVLLNICDEEDIQELKKIGRNQSIEMLSFTLEIIEGIAR